MRKTKALLPAIGLVLLLSLLSAAQDGKVESAGPLTDTAVPEQVRQSLQENGYRLTLDDPKPACELWLRKSVPAQAKKEAEGVAYPQLAESTLVGVVHFPQAASDFRGQQVPAGFYTLRYALMPDDGNHLGVSPNRDFLLLIPAQSDSDPSATFKFQELITMSAKTVGAKHPSAAEFASRGQAVSRNRRQGRSGPLDLFGCLETHFGRGNPLCPYSKGHCPTITPIRKRPSGVQREGFYLWP